eukprot:scaffold376758_cov45-Prasinocladus_malaysianus.AAC.1
MSLYQRLKSNTWKRLLSDWEFSTCETVTATNECAVSADVTESMKVAFTKRHAMKQFQESSFDHSINIIKIRLVTRGHHLIANAIAGTIFLISLAKLPPLAARARVVCLALPEGPLIQRLTVAPVLVLDVVYVVHAQQVRLEFLVHPANVLLVVVVKVGHIPDILRVVGGKGGLAHPVVVVVLRHVDEEVPR